MAAKDRGVDSVGLGVGQMAHLVIMLQPTRVQNMYRIYQEKKADLEARILSFRNFKDKLKAKYNYIISSIETFKGANDGLKQQYAIERQKDLNEIYKTMYKNFYQNLEKKKIPQYKVSPSPKDLVDVKFNRQFTTLKAYRKAIQNYTKKVLLPIINKNEEELTELETKYNPDI